MSMTLAERIDALVRLGDFIIYNPAELDAVVRTTEQYNRWLTEANSRRALNNFAIHFLRREALEAWVAGYPALQEEHPSRRVGLVLAGNIPAVGFHDVLCTFVAGHQALIKYSDKDRFLIPFLLERLADQDARTKVYFERVERLRDFDAVIATGSNNSALYFKQYFEHYPHIIRQNRNAVAVLTGEETPEQLCALSEDIFAYFGLGCRSVSKLYVPEGYNFTSLLEILDEDKAMMQHNKYKNNYDYNRSIYLLNRTPHLANDCIMLLEDPSLLSRIAALHYEQYPNRTTLEERLSTQRAQIQCIVGAEAIGKHKVVPFGNSQAPHLQDYADGVDTMAFLLSVE